MPGILLSGLLDECWSRKGLLITKDVQEEAEEDYEEMNQNVNSDDEEIAILEDDDPGLNSTDDENEGTFPG